MKFLRNNKNVLNNEFNMEGCFVLNYEQLLAESLEDSEDDEGAEMAQAMLSSAKCRIMLSKKVLPDIETAYFEGQYGQSCCD